MGFVLFGLTGGLASGKSSVAARWRTRGLAIIDADEVARAVVAPGTEGLAQVVDLFGPEVMKPDGSLDRKSMGVRVFTSPEWRQKLEAITHPRIAAETQNRARELEARGVPLACYEAALLIERGIEDAFRPLVVVAAPPEAQVKRAAVRDGLSQEDARARLAAQLPLERKCAVADFVIRNEGTLADLLARADDVLDAVCTSLRIDARLYPR